MLVVFFVEYIEFLNFKSCNAEVECLHNARFFSELDNTTKEVNSIPTTGLKFFSHSEIFRESLLERSIAHYGRQLDIKSRKNQLSWTSDIKYHRDFRNFTGMLKTVKQQSRNCTIFNNCLHRNSTTKTYVRSKSMRVHFLQSTHAQLWRKTGHNLSYNVICFILLMSLTSSASRLLPLNNRELSVAIAYSCQVTSALSAEKQPNYEFLNTNLWCACMALIVLLFWAAGLKSHLSMSVSGIHVVSHIRQPLTWSWYMYFGCLNLPTEESCVIRHMKALGCGEVSSTPRALSCTGRQDRI